MSNKITVHIVPNTDILVVKKNDPDNKFFISTSDSVIISRRGFITLVNYLVQNGYLSKKVIEGILEEYNTL